MSGTFRKAVLRQGVYNSPDGTVVVTPERLRHWAAQVKRVQAARYAIPMHWDHATDLELLEPIKLDVLHERKTRSAQNTIGTLLDFVVSPDGESAEITLETLTERASEAASANAVSVSPVIFTEWKDGKGNVYTDTIGSIDFVNYPVDNSQGPFIPVHSATQALSCRIRMSTTPQVFRMATDPDSESEDSFGTEMASEPASNPVGSGPDGDAMDTPPSGGTSVSDVIEALAKLSIMLPLDTTTESFLERLRPALMTAIAARQQPEPEQPATSLPPEESPQDQDTPVLAEQPQIAAMSALQRRIDKLESDRIAASRARLSERIQALLTSGRCFPVECNAKRESLRVQKLSVGTDCNVNAGELEVWLASREALPKGACWSAEERVTKLGTKLVDAPTTYGTKNSITATETDEAVAKLTKRHK